jgi:LDH2 family malate/lactate/ureidoglycolate dehydrogenase
MSEAAVSATPETGDFETIEAERLRQFCHAVFEKLGMTSEDAALVADYFVWTELRGLPYVGARRIPEFVARLRDGGTRLPTNGGVTVVQKRESFVLVDAEDTFAQISGTRAMNIAVEKAQFSGVGVAVVRNTTSAGNLGYYAMLAAERGMIGMAINNTAPVMAAWGSATGVIGAQPFAVASPAGRHEPLLLDMTNSVMSMVRMHEYQARGESLPDGAALTSDGVPTNDPAAAIAGTLLPVGHRAYGLAVMWEIITGVLSGGERFGGDVGHPSRHGDPMGVSLFFMAIDPTSSTTYESFAARVDEFIDHLHASQTAGEGDRVRVPGERSQGVAHAREKDGIPLPADVIEVLTKVGSGVGVKW